MNKLSVVAHTFFAVVCAVLINTATHAEPANLAQLTEQVQAYHDSGDYEKEVTAIVDKAREYVNKRAEQNAQSRHPQKLAIILDIDETSLSNYKYMVARHFHATKEQLHREIMAAEAPAIQPMLALYQDAIQHHIAVFFVTGRHEAQRYATMKNLKAAGFHTWAGLYLKPDNYRKSSVIPFKSKAREAIARKGYTIVMNVGDQHSDLNGGFAEKSFKLPNPYYYLP